MNDEIFRSLSILPKAKKTDSTLINKEEFFEKLDKAEENIAQGKGKTFTHSEEMNAWLNAL